MKPVQVQFSHPEWILQTTGYATRETIVFLTFCSEMVSNKWLYIQFVAKELYTITGVQLFRWILSQMIQGQNSTVRDLELGKMTMYWGPNAVVAQTQPEVTYEDPSPNWVHFAYYFRNTLLIYIEMEKIEVVFLLSLHLESAANVVKRKSILNVR